MTNWQNRDKIITNSLYSRDKILPKIETKSRQDLDKILSKILPKPSQNHPHPLPVAYCWPFHDDQQPRRRRGREGWWISFRRRIEISVVSEIKKWERKRQQVILRQTNRLISHRDADHFYTRSHPAKNPVHWTKNGNLWDLVVDWIGFMGREKHFIRVHPSSSSR